MSYLEEFRQNLRPLAAASLGTSMSHPLFAYTNSVFAPHLLKEFGWHPSQFALVGLTMFATLAIIPFVGRFTDLLGVRRVALIGTLLVPCGFIAYSMQQGNFYVFLSIFTFVLITANLTSQLVYSRLIVEHFDKATGLALTVVNSMPAVLAIALVPGLNAGIEAFGWRSMYLVLGGFVLVCGLIAVILVPRDQNRSSKTSRAACEGPAPVPASARNDYGAILSSKVFWTICASIFLCLLISPLHSSQMNLMLLDNGVSTQAASMAVSIYAAGTIVGRITCGLALDRFPTRLVAFASMGLPSLGFFLLGTDYNAFPVIAFCMFLIGLTVGAESDIIPFLVARYFHVRVFGSTMGLVTFVMFFASGIGSMILSATLSATSSFSLYLFIVSVTVALGSVAFLLLPRSASKVG